MSVQDFVDPQWTCSNMARVPDYLRSAPVVVACFRQRDDCIFGGRHCVEQHASDDGEWAGYAIRSDGVYIWPDDLVHYVKHHGVRIPEDMLDEMVRRDFRPPVDRPTSLPELNTVLATIPAISRRFSVRRWLADGCEVRKLMGLRRLLLRLPPPKVNRRTAVEIARDAVAQQPGGGAETRLARIDEAPDRYYVYFLPESRTGTYDTARVVTVDNSSGLVLHVDDAAWV